MKSSFLLFMSLACFAVSAVLFAFAFNFGEIRESSKSVETTAYEYIDKRDIEIKRSPSDPYVIREIEGVHNGGSREEPTPIVKTYEFR